MLAACVPWMVPAAARADFYRHWEFELARPAQARRTTQLAESDFTSAMSVAEARRRIGARAFNTSAIERSACAGAHAHATPGFGPFGRCTQAGDLECM